MDSDCEWRLILLVTSRANRTCVCMELIQYIAQQSAQPPGQSTPTESTPAANGGISSFFMPLMMVAVFGFMYFFLIRPQRKEEKRKKEMLSTLKKGDPVVTSGGMYGTVETVKENTVVVRVGDNTRIEFLRSAIAGIREGGLAAKRESKKG